jgi:hypothetical protein
MFMLEIRSMSWWYWLATVCLLTAGLTGWPNGFLFAIALTTFQLAHFLLRERRISAFPVQVRIGYLLLLLLAYPAALQWIYWIPTLGTWAQVIFGYCTMARLVSLLPWNRGEAFTAGLLKRTLLSRPVRGNILQGLPPA